MTISRKTAWFLWSIAVLFYMYQYLARVMTGPLSLEIREFFGMSEKIFGQFAGVYYIGYSLGHIPAGLMLDRLGPRKVIPGGVVLVALGLMTMIIKTHWIVPVFGRLLVGAGSSVAILGGMKIMHFAFPKERFARMLSLFVTVALVGGGINGTVPLSMLNDTLGYTATIKIIISGAVLVGLATYFGMPKTHQAHTTSVSEDLKMVLGNHRVVLYSVCGGLLIGAMEGFSDGWGKEFFMKVYGLESLKSVYLASLVLYGFCFGPLLTLIPERVGYIISSIWAGVVMVVAFALILMGCVPDGIILQVLLFSIGLASVYQLWIIYCSSTFVPDHLAGLASVVSNLFIMSFGYVFHSVVSMVIEGLGGAQDVHALIGGVSVIPLGVALGTVGFIILMLLDKRAGRKIS